MTLLVLAAYLAVFSMFLPTGINQYFAERSWPRFLAIAIILIAVLYARGGLPRILQRSTSADRTTTSAVDLVLLLLPMTPIVQYMLLNQHILSVVDATLFFAAFAALAAVMVLLLPHALRNFVARPMLMSATLAMLFVVTSMASLANEYVWHQKGSLNLQLSVFAVAFVLCGWLYALRREVLCVVIAVYFCSSVLFTALAVDGEPLLDDRSRLHALTIGKEVTGKPDIYVLTYDSYVTNETMSQYGIDNNAQETYLEELGFKLYGRVYSAGATTITSMGSLLSPGVSAKDGHYEAVSGQGDVQRILNQQGYQTFGVFTNGYFFERNGSNYDHNFPPEIPSYRLLWTAVLEGEFRFDIGKATHSEFIDTKRAVMRSQTTSPKFMYTHTGPWHSQNSGSCLENETELFAERLHLANVEMKDDIETILKNSPDAIIIVNGDHGPYLTKNCHALSDEMFRADDITRLDIQDRFATFLAIRWPDEAHARFDDISILQDVFPVVLAYLFDDSSLLDARMEKAILRELSEKRIAGVTVVDGVIRGGVNDGEPLFESMD